MAQYGYPGTMAIPVAPIEGGEQSWLDCLKTIELTQPQAGYTVGEGGGGKKVQFLLEVTDGIFGIKATVDGKLVAFFASWQRVRDEQWNDKVRGMPPGARGLAIRNTLRDDWRLPWAKYGSSVTSASLGNT